MSMLILLLTVDTDNLQRTSVILFCTVAGFLCAVCVAVGSMPAAFRRLRAAHPRLLVQPNAIGERVCVGSKSTKPKTGALATNQAAAGCFSLPRFSQERCRLKSHKAIQAFTVISAVAIRSDRIALSGSWLSDHAAYTCTTNQPVTCLESHNSCCWVRHSPSTLPRDHPTNFFSKNSALTAAHILVTNAFWTTVICDL